MKRIWRITWEDTHERVKEGKVYQRHYYDILDNEIYVDRNEKIQIVDSNDNDFTVIEATFESGETTVLPY